MERITVRTPSPEGEGRGEASLRVKRGLLLIKLLTLFLLLSSNLLLAQTNINFLGRRTYGQDLSDVWGYAANGKEYALVGAHSGVSIVDVTNPATPTELFFVSTNSSDWHDIATWNGYAYITNEGGGGLKIVDLNPLPDSIEIYNWTGGSLGLNTAHTVFADENGIAYIAGGNNSAGRGLLMLDLTANPTNPTLVGRYDLRYVHDVYVRGDTAWAAEINNGIFTVLDVSDKANPVILATNSTPSNKAHNTWLSGDGKTLLTTDEVSNSFGASYDVSDLGNITLLDMYQHNSGSGSVIHNIHYVGDFAVASYYRDGVVIIDVTDPENIIEVGHYDTSPFSGGGFNGAWSVYPYLPSGNLIVSDIEQGLFVLGPVYQKACYLEGKVTDISSGSPLNNVSVTILPSNPTEATSLTGDYKTGIVDSGTYSVQFLKAGYQTHVEQNVLLKNGIVTTLNVQMIPAIPITFTGSVVDVSNGQKIPYSFVLFENSINRYIAITDTNGDFQIDSFETGIYNGYAGEWGYITKHQGINVFSAGTTAVIGLQSGYYDDFIFDFPWGTNSTAATGHWWRDEPIGTDYNGVFCNPGADVSTDYGRDCYVTGNGGGDAGDDDVDDGTVTLISPWFDLSGFNDPVLTYSRWFFNDGGANGGGSPDDALVVKLSNGTDTVVVETLTASSPQGWNQHEIRIKDFVTLSSEMELIFETGDNASDGHLVEAGVDLFFIRDSSFIVAPVVDFVTDKTEGCPGTSFTLADSSANDPDTWFWEFPGGTPPSSTDSVPTVTYINPGTYNITLSATNAGGSSSTTKTSFIVIRETPFVQASVDDASGPSNADGSVTLSFSSGTPPYSVQWSNGSTSATVDSLLPGVYGVTVTDSFGCVKEDSVTVDFTDAITGISQVAIKAYPNPFDESILIESDESVEIVFFNAIGMEVDNIKVRGGKPAAWGWFEEPGVYFVLVVKNGIRQKVIKVVKTR